jgi:hypothetical protein
VNVQSSLSVFANAIQSFTFLDDVPDNASVIVNYGWLSQSPTPLVSVRFSTPCELFEPSFIVNASLICGGVPSQIQLIAMDKESCSEGSLKLQVQRSWFTSPSVLTKCQFQFSLHSSLTPNSITSNSFLVTFGPPFALHLLGQFPSAPLSSGDTIYSVNSTSGLCIVACFVDASGFRVTIPGISARLSAQTSSLDHYEIGVIGSNSLVSLTQSGGNVSWCGVTTKLVVPSAFLQVSWAVDGQSLTKVLPQSVFSVNRSGTSAVGNFTSTATNISVLSGQGLPSVQLIMTDAAGNTYTPLPLAFIRIIVIPLVSSRRLLVAEAESSATCEAGGPRFVPLTSSEVVIPSSIVYACTAGTSQVQYDVVILTNGVVTNYSLVNGSVSVVSPAIASFSIQVSSGPAASFGFFHSSLAEFFTYTLTSDAFLVICLDFGRNVRFFCRFDYCPLTLSCRLSIAAFLLICILPALCPFLFGRRR